MHQTPIENSKKMIWLRWPLAIELLSGDFQCKMGVQLGDAIQNLKLDQMRLHTLKRSIAKTQFAVNFAISQLLFIVYPVSVRMKI